MFAFWLVTWSFRLMFRIAWWSFRLFVWLVVAMFTATIAIARGVTGPLRRRRRIRS